MVSLIKRNVYSVQISNPTPQEIAAKCDLWIGYIRTGWNTMEEGRAAKNLRPDLKTLLYINALILYSPNVPTMNETFQANGWILKNVNGNYVNDGNGAWLDFGNPAVHQWIANMLKGYIDTYNLDGVQLDNVCCTAGTAFWGATSTSPSQVINPRTGRAWTDDEVLEGYKGLISAVKQALGANKIVYANSGDTFNGENAYASSTYVSRLLLESQLDGIMSESWISSCTSPYFLPEASWQRSIDLAMWIEDNFLSRGNKIYVTGSDNVGTLWPAKQILLPPDATQEQYALFCYASRLLTVKHEGGYIHFGYYMPYAYPQSLFQIDIGTPLGNYYKDANNLYVRDFTKGKVKVNPSSTSRGGLSAHSAEITLTPPPQKGHLEIHAFLDSQEIEIPYEVTETGD